MSYTEVGWASDGTHPLSQANMKTLDAGLVELDSSAKGQLGYAQTTSNQLSLGSTDTDLTGLSVTVDIPAGRRIRISGHGNIRSDAVSQASIRIKEGANMLQLNAGSIAAANFDYSATPQVVMTPSAGSHTYKLAAVVSAGSGSLRGSSTFPAFILVEDIGGV